MVYIPMPADQNHQQLRLCSGVRSFQQAPQAYKARRPTVPRLVATTGWSTTPTPPGCAEIVLQAEGELSLSALRTRRRTRCPRDLPRGCGVQSSFSSRMSFALTQARKPPAKFAAERRAVSAPHFTTTLDHRRSKQRSHERCLFIIDMGL